MMDSDNTGDICTAASIELTSPQAELLTLLEKLVCLATSDAMSNMQALPEFRATIRSLCNKAPEVARCFAMTILEFSATNSATWSSKCKSTSNKDLSYRPPRSVKTAEKADQQQSIAQDDSVQEREKAADNRDTIDTAGDKETKKKIPEARTESGSKKD
jgi:hypothetical protein